MKEQSKKRLDQLVYELGFADSKSKAKSLIMAGTVYVNGQKSDKPGTMIRHDAEVMVEDDRPKYVSRGGYKLEKAIEHFDINVKNRIALDIGASTGGFTDCLLQYGASKVYAFDVGHGQLDWKLRKDTRVIVKEKINCRYIDKSDTGEIVDIVTVDVSFISLLKVVRPAVKLMKSSGDLITLVKPQFEVGKDSVEKGGIIRDKNKHEMVIRNISSEIRGLGLTVKGVVEAPVKGAKGNTEYLMHAVFS